MVFAGFPSDHEAQQCRYWLVYMFPGKIAENSTYLGDIVAQRSALPTVNIRCHREGTNVDIATES